MAPKATYSIQNPLYLIFKAILFVLAAIALAVAGRQTLAWVLGALFVLNTLLDFIIPSTGL